MEKERKSPVVTRFVKVKLSREIVEGMIDTYECLLYQCSGSDDAKICSKIIKALKKSL